MSMQIDTKQFNAFLLGLDKTMVDEFRKDFRKSANALKKEIKADYGGRVLRRRSGKTAKSVRTAVPTFRAIRRGRPVTARVFTRHFVARLHEKGYTHPGGRVVPGNQIFETQTIRHEPEHQRQMQDAMRKAIARARR